MSIQYDVLSCLDRSGTTDQVRERYVKRFCQDRDHGVPEVDARVYGALRRLKASGRVVSERVYSGRNGRATTVCVWRAVESCGGCRMNDALTPARGEVLKRRRRITVSITVDVNDPELLIREVRARLIEENAGDPEMVDREVMPDPETNLELVVQHAFDTLGFRSEGFEIIDSNSHAERLLDREED